MSTSAASNGFLQPQPRTQRCRPYGALAGAPALETLEAALHEAKAERIAAIERRWM